MTDENARIGTIAMKIDIAASPEQVWQSLTTDIGQWWPDAFYAGGKPGARRYTLEPHPGGRMCEEWEDGGGVLWGTVVTASPAEKLQVLGLLFPEWGGPANCFGTWELSANESGTTLAYSETTMGRVSDANLAEKDKGWQFLWRCLKAHVEGTEAPQWSD